MLQKRNPRSFHFAGFVGPVLRVRLAVGFLSGFFLRLGCSCFFLRWILGAGLSERARVDLSSARTPIPLTHSLLPCSAQSTAAPLRCPTAAPQSCRECGHRRLPV